MKEMQEQEEKRYGRRRTDREPHPGLRPVLWIAVAVFVADWATKAAITARLPVGSMVEVVPERVAFWHVRNPAMILGLFGDLPLAGRQALAVLLGATAAALLVQVLRRAHRLLPARRPWAWLFGGLLAGGMVGNLGERAVHWSVTDFLSFRWGAFWLPPGNVADLAVVASIPIALLVVLFELEARSLRGTGARDSLEPTSGAIVGMSSARDSWD
jgi:lipoprotein signal peptidase